MISRITGRSAAVMLAAVVAGLLCLWPQVAGSGGTPATGTTSDQLINQQGSGVPTEYGDYIASNNGSGLNSAYSYWLEVPPGLARLVVEIFDADVYAGGAADLAGERDRQLTSGGSVEYRLFDPSGTEVTTNFTVGNATSPAGADNAWLVLYDTQAFASFAEVTTASNTVPPPPTFESLSTATAGSDTTSLTIGLPTGTTNGDLLVAIVSTDGNETHTAPGGWTLINRGQSPGGATLSLWYRVAGSSEPGSYTFTWGTNEEAAGGVLRYSGVNTTTPINVSGVATNTNNSPTAPSVTTTVDNTMVLRAYGADDNDLGGDPYPSGTTGRFNIQSSGGNGTTSAGAADAVQATAGATGTAAFSLSASEQWRAATVAIAPGALNLEALTLTTPPATQSGDLLIATASTDGSVTVSAPSGWTSINQGQSASNASTLGVWYRVADGTESPTYTFTWTGQGDQEAAGSISRYIGIDTSNPIDGSGVATGTSAAPTAPSVTTSNADSVVLRIFGSDGSETSTTPTGTTERFNLTSSATAGEATTTSGADALQATAGASGAAAFTLGGSQEWRAVTVVINSDPSLSSIDNGHWELRVDMSSAVTSGTPVNAFGFRAHDGNSGSGGTEINAYTDSFTITGVNQNGGNRDYDYFPYVTSGCDFDISNFDFDDQGGTGGSMAVASRSGSFSQSIATMSGNDAWSSNNFTGWTALAAAADYGIWDLDVNISDYGSGNYGPVYVRDFASSGTPPTSQPAANTFRMYFPTDSGGAPAKPYITQYLRYVNGSGPNPPTSGNTTRYAVTLQVVNPPGAAGSITFDSSNLVIANVPGSGVTYYAAATAVNGTIVSEPTYPGGVGDVEWNPGTVAPGGTAAMVYQVEVTGTGSNIVVTGEPGSGDGTRASYLDHTGNSSQARATVALGELCQLTVDGANATHTAVRLFETFATAGGVTVEWTTAAEAGTIGFDLYRFDDDLGDYVKVNVRPLTGLLDAPQGGTYRFLDAAVSVRDQATYMLVERDSGGRVSAHGPFTPVLRWDNGADPAVGDFERVKRPASRRHMWAKSQKALRRASDRRVPGGRGKALKITVREGGLYRVEAADIADDLGTSIGDARRLLERGRLSLTHRGHPVAWQVADDGGGLEFYATSIDSIYTRDNVYWLARGQGVRMERRAGVSPGAAAGVASFRDTVHFEEDAQPVIALPLDPEGDFWFWNYVRAGDPDHGAAAFEVPVSGFDGSAAEPFDLTVSLQGGSSHRHEVEIWLNGEWIGSVQVDEVDEAIAVFESLSPHLLINGLNTLEVRAVAGGIVFVDSFDFSYDRAYRAEDGRELRHAANGNPTVTVSGFSIPDIRVFDLSDPSRPVELMDILVTGEASLGYDVTYRPESYDSSGLAMTSAAVRVPAELTPDHPSHLRSSSNGADYVIITTRELMDAAGQLAGIRRFSGLETRVVDVVDIYDEFNHGIVDPNAIRDFLSYAYFTWSTPPRYVLLGSAGSADFRDILGYGGNLIPPMMAVTNETIAGIFATDSLYADVVGDDGVPEFALGRLPVLTAGEFVAYAAKVSDYEYRSEPSQSVLMLADNADGGGDFPSDSDRLLEILPEGYDSTRIYLSELGIEGARELLFEKIQGGAGLVNYLGHGGVTNIASEGLLTVDDMPMLAGASLAPVITTFSCYIGYFAIPGFDSLGEVLVLDPDGGATAVIAPNFLSQNAQARVLNDRFLRELIQGENPILGDAFRRTLEAASGSVEKTTLQKYGILGDPALILQLEPGEVDHEGGGGSGGLG